MKKNWLLNYSHLNGNVRINGESHCNAYMKSFPHNYSVRGDVNIIL